MARRGSSDATAPIPCTGTRYCPRCKATKHILAFSVDKKAKSSVNSDCRECQSAAKKKRAIRRPLSIRFNIGILDLS